MKLLQAKIEAGIVKNEPDGSGARSSDAGTKHSKLPNFQDGRDDFDIWMTRFGRFAESNGWSREKWSSSLCALLTGRALDCYGRLSAEQAEDYDKVKETLMKRYDLTEDGYRRKFRTSKPAEGESLDIFIVRIVMYLDRWIELSKTDKSYEKLRHLIVREQFMDACPEDLARVCVRKTYLQLKELQRRQFWFYRPAIGSCVINLAKCFWIMLGLEWTLCGRLNQRRSLTVDTVQGRRRRAWLIRGCASKCKKTGHIARYCTAVDSTTGAIHQK
ncbi:retroviral-like aspartic protease 1 [Plakobranchus ocellatus]|uniref:Retroviral-like aspartic protease 1 n=1 Tax=Plakobranchus ocellatus TaxID=259542 RepID=A0AAV4DUR4_9GAST|nr:retroviral-like aspartic protease 1 [Plakobranchus ocellatus]